MTLLLPAYNKLIGGGGGPILSSGEFLAMGGTDYVRTLDIELPVDGLLFVLFTYRATSFNGCSPRMDGSFFQRFFVSGGGISVDTCVLRASAGTRTITLSDDASFPGETDLAWYLLPYDDGSSSSLTPNADRDPLAPSSTADDTLTLKLDDLSGTAHHIVSAVCYRDNTTPPDVLSLTGWSSYEDVQFDAGPRGISASLSVSAPLNPGPSITIADNNSDGFQLQLFSLRPYDATLTI